MYMIKQMWFSKDLFFLFFFIPSSNLRYNSEMLEFIQQFIKPDYHIFKVICAFYIAYRTWLEYYLFFVITFN